MNEFSKTLGWGTANPVFLQLRPGAIYSRLLGTSHLLLPMSQTPSVRIPCFPFSLPRGAYLVNRSALLTFVFLATGNKIQTQMKIGSSVKSRAGRRFIYKSVSPRKFHRTLVFLWTNTGNSWFGRPLLPIYKEGLFPKLIRFWHMLLVGIREQHSSVDLGPNRSEPERSPGPGLDKL